MNISEYNTTAIRRIIREQNFNAVEAVEAVYIHLNQWSEFPVISESDSYGIVNALIVNMYKMIKKNEEIEAIIRPVTIENLDPVKTTSTLPVVNRSIGVEAAKEYLGNTKEYAIRNTLACIYMVAVIVYTLMV